MRKVWRYVLNKRTTVLEVPRDFFILKVGIKGATQELSVWMEVTNPDEEDTVKVTFIQLMTDESIPDGFEYLETIESPVESGFIYHVYVAWE